MNLAKQCFSHAPNQSEVTLKMVSMLVIFRGTAIDIMGETGGVILEVLVH